MTELILTLVPSYGLILVFAVVAIACMAIPLPSSMLVVASGSFAAAGDLLLWQVLLVAFAAFVIGDQLAYCIARRVGPPLVQKLLSVKKLKPIVEKSQTLVNKHGQSAVFISHTIISPTGPFVTYISGASGMTWRTFSSAAIPGAAVWIIFYVMLGYSFADQLTQLSEILSNFVGIISAAVTAILSLLWLRKRWALAKKQHVLNPESA